ncbi:hypothetical protein LZ30DRAFT_468405 [Colletotrichum cereale]|nr:hypothetical protein LZ30DRAFT_468405 [Colletotrichum cereale]
MPHSERERPDQITVTQDFPAQPRTSAHMGLVARRPWLDSPRFIVSTRAGRARDRVGGMRHAPLIWGIPPDLLGEMDASTRISRPSANRLSVDSPRPTTHFFFFFNFFLFSERALPGASCHSGRCASKTSAWDGLVVSHMLAETQQQLTNPTNY